MKIKLNDETVELEEWDQVEVHSHPTDNSYYCEVQIIRHAKVVKALEIG